MSYENPWTLDGKIVDTEDIKDYYGFVYCITNLADGRKYIGKKFFYASKTKQVKKKKKRYKAESDWKTYYGSNDALKEDVNTLGKDKFKREILRLCKTKGTCNYYEAREQFVLDVLRDPNYYNIWIQVKVHKSHIKD
jgi:hypothetical protein